jgi:hypothetical protein
VIINTQNTTPFYIPELELLDNSGTVVLSLNAVYSGNEPAGTMSYVDPVTLASTDYAMRSHLWQFNFNLLGTFLVTPLTTGMYRLRATVYSEDILISRQYISDAILLYEKHLGTVLIESRNLTNRSSQGIVLGSYGTPTFQHRVEGCIWDYDPNGVYTGYLQQQYLYLQQNAINFRTWIFSLGTNTEGVPAQVHEKINEALSTDYWTIDGKPFQLNKSDSDGVSKLWETNDPKLSINRWASTPIRERYSNQHVFVTVTPTPDLLLWTIPDPATPYAVADYIINTGSMSVPIARMVFYNSTDEDTYIAAFSALYPSLGGSLLRSAGKMFYVPAPSETPSIFGVAPRVLTTYMELKYSVDSFDTSCGFRVAGSGSLQVIDWGDGTSYQQYEYFTGALNTQTHTYVGGASLSIVANVFHNNDIGQLQFAEDGTFYTATSNIISILGDLPDGMNTIFVVSCPQFGIDNSNIGQLDLTNCPLIYWIAIQTNTSLLGVDTALLFPAPQPSLLVINMSNNIFPDAAVDAVINDYANTSWNGTLGGGGMSFLGAGMGNPTAASLTNRNLLLAATPPWSILF